MTEHCENTGDYLLSHGRPDHTAVVDGARSYTYAQLRAAAGRLAAELTAAGLPPGSPVGVLGPNSFFWVAAYVAAMKLGHVAVPLSDKIAPEQAGRNLERVGCRAVFADRRALRRFGAAMVGNVVVITDDVLEDGRVAPWPKPTTVPRDLDAVLTFTSGTTAQPKVVRVTHGNIQANTESIVAFLNLRSDDRALVILPFFYCYGASVLHTHLRVGGRVVLCNSFVFPEAALDQLERERCTVFAGVPSTFQLLLRASSFATRPLSSLRLVQQAGGKLAPSLIREFLEARPTAQLFVMYGQTEATARLSYLPPERLRDKLGSVGRGIPGVELTVLDEHGRPVTPGVRGEIYARGENISPGYLDDRAGSAEKFTPHGLRTGDLAVVDDDGFIFIVGRRDDFIKSWGHRISSQEIEECVLRMTNSLSAGAVGVPHTAAGEAVTLFVTAAPGTGLTAGDVLRFCRAHLPKYMVPHSVHIVESLPVNANGKTDKPRLRELALTCPEGGLAACPE